MACTAKDMEYGRVLLADAHLNMLGGVHSLLDTLFSTVLMVADERSLIEVIATFRPELVVVDLSLPATEDAHVAARLHGQYAALPIIVLSVHDEPTVVMQLLEKGAVGYVLKRTAATDLVPAVHEVLSGGTYISPALRRNVGDAGGVKMKREPRHPQDGVS